MIRKITENRKELKEKLKEEQQNRQIAKMADDREKSSNERELEAYIKKKREEKIKLELDKIHKKQTRETWSDNSLLKSSYNILDNGKGILTGDKHIFLQKSIFLDNKIKNPVTNQRMFFK